MVYQSDTITALDERFLNKIVAYSFDVDYLD